MRLHALIVAITVTFLSGCYNVVIINLGVDTRQATPLAPGIECVVMQNKPQAVKECEKELQREMEKKKTP
jgi:hypothetical protein